MNALKARRLIYAYLSDRAVSMGVDAIFGEEIYVQAIGNKRLMDTIEKAQKDVSERLAGFSKGQKLAVIVPVSDRLNDGWVL